MMFTTYKDYQLSELFFVILLTFYFCLPLFNIGIFHIYSIFAGIPFFVSLAIVLLFRKTLPSFWLFLFTSIIFATSDSFLGTFFLFPFVLIAILSLLLLLLLLRIVFESFHLSPKTLFHLMLLSGVPFSLCATAISDYQAIIPWPEHPSIVIALTLIFSAIGLSLFIFYFSYAMTVLQKKTEDQCGKRSQAGALVFAVIDIACDSNIFHHKG